MEEHARVVGPMNGKFAFTKRSDGTIDKGRVICLLCKKEFAYHRSNASLAYHIKAKHPASAATANASSEDVSNLVSHNKAFRQTNLDEITPRMSKYGTNKLANVIAKWIAMNCGPTNIVEDEGSTEELQTASNDPSYKPPRRTTVTTKIMKMYDGEKKNNPEILAEDSPNYVSTAGDIRTSAGNHNYLGATGHFIDGQQRIQPVMPISGPVSAPHLVMPAQLTSAITNFVIMDLQPPGLVEGEGFRQLLHTLLPSYRELPLSYQVENLLRDHHAKGKASFSQLLRSRSGSEENEEISDYTAPIEFEPKRRGRPPSHQREVPHSVTLSVDVWLHSWQGNTERYLTLWAHYIDDAFSLHNLALSTQRLIESGEENDTIQVVEAQVKAMAKQWGMSQPNLVLLGVEGRSRVRLRPIKSEKGVEATGSASHPNSTTFLERDDSASSEEAHAAEHSHFSEGLPSVPCFFSAVQGCIEEVMSHPVIFSTLSHFQGIISTIFLPPTQNKDSFQYHAQSLLQGLTKQEQERLKSWAHSRPTWNLLYPLLSVLIKNKSLVCDAIKEITSGSLTGEENAPEFNTSGSCGANSTSNTPSTGLHALRSEWKVVEELCLVLKPLDVACRTLAKEAFPRLSLIKPILTGLLTRHLVPRPGDSSTVLKEVKRMMRRNLTSCYDNPAVNRVLSVACSLDPQFHGLGFMEEQEQTATLNWLKKEAVRMVKEDRRKSQTKTLTQIKRSSSPESPESESDFLRRSKRLKECPPINFRELADDDNDSEAGDVNNSESVEPGSQAGLSGMEFLLGDLFCSAPRSRHSSVEESVDMEMSVFKADKGASMGVEPLQWWRMKAVQFPLLASVARAYLAAPAVAGNAAQDFVRDGARTTHRKRSNIPPESLDAILFLHLNNINVAESGQAAAKSDDRNNGSEMVP